jgi:cation:H+ antiporter
MMLPDFSQFATAINAGIFCVGAVFVWRAGFRLSLIADRISNKTGIGQALIGLLLLAGVTSLPELAVAVSAASGGNERLAVNNMLGGVAMQVALLGIADATIRDRALTAIIPDSVVLLQGALNVVLLSLVAIGILVGDIGFAGAGLWSWAVAAGWLIAMWMLARNNQRQPWLANIDEKARPPIHKDKDQESAGDEPGLRALIFQAAVAAVVILVAGFVVTRSGEAIAEQSGLGQNFFGFVFVAIATSLPEVSTVLAAVRLGLFTMAISDILGTNLLNAALIFLVDLISPGPAVLGEVGEFAAAAALLGILVTAIYLVGLAERRDQHIFGMAYDSIVVLVVYLGGVGLLYTLR